MFNRMKFSMGGALSLMIAVMVVPSSYAGVILPACTIGTTCLQFQDFSVYSLALLNFQGGEGDIGPGDSFYVRSAGQPINDAIVVASSPGGRRNNTDLGLGSTLDNAYDTPSNVPHGDSVNFLMVETDPNPTFTGDNSNQTSAVNDPESYSPADDPDSFQLPLWDIQTSALRDFLNGDDLVFWFNLNEVNKTAEFTGANWAEVLDDGQDMLAWAQVILSDTSGMNADLVFELGGQGATEPFQSLGQTSDFDGNPANGIFGDAILPTADDEWAWVHGFICVADGSGSDPAGTFMGLGVCSGAQKANGGQNVKQNLGSDIAAFAIFSELLNNEVLDVNSPYDLMTVDFRMAHIDNGFEQLFIQAATRTTNVPEPAVLMLFSLGLLVLGLVRRKRNRIK